MTLFGRQFHAFMFGLLVPVIAWFLVVLIPGFIGLLRAEGVLP